jgi:hypothetical protein
VVEDLLKVRSGFTLLDAFLCPSLSPWQAAQLGVRTSAVVPCLVFPMGKTASSSPWQSSHFFSAAKANPPLPARKVKMAAVASKWRKNFMLHGSEKWSTENAPTR